jgi:hypothetical protein
MKIALCFSGNIRDLDETKHFWKSLIDKYNIDVYASFWDVENLENNDTIENFNSIYSPKKIEIDSYKIFKETTQDIASMNIESPNHLAEFFKNTSKNFAQLPMWYKIWKCNLLTKGIEPYDLIIRARTDIMLDDNFEIIYNDMLNVPMGSNNSVWVNSNGINDCFAYANPRIMDYYSFLFLQMMEYLNSGHYVFPPEHFLAVHFSKIHIQIRYFPNYMTITRKWKGTPNEIYNIFMNEPLESFRFSDSIEFIPDPTGNFKKEIKDDFIV